MPAAVQRLRMSPSFQHLTLQDAPGVVSTASERSVLGGTGDQDLRGGDRADAALGQRPGQASLMISLVPGFDFEGQGAPGGAADRGDRGAVLDALSGDGAEARAARELLVGAVADVVSRGSGWV